jgi:hypothetical protein
MFAFGNKSPISSMAELTLHLVLNSPQSIFIISRDFAQLKQRSRSASLNCWKNEAVVRHPVLL